MTTLKEHPMEDIIAEMRQEFGAFWNYIYGDPRLLDPTWSKVCMSYGEPHRAYHTLQHIQEMLHLLRGLEKGLTGTEVATLEAAIWSHDIVYRTSEQAVLSPLTNEDLSAAWAYRTFNEAKPPIFGRAVAALVESTALPQDEVLGTLQEYIHDMDYAILGTFSEERLREYEDQIREEWKHIPLEHYLKHRKDFLEKLKKKGYVFCSIHFEGAYGDRAKENIDTLLGWVEDDTKEISK